MMRSRFIGHVSLDDPSHISPTANHPVCQTPPLIPSLLLNCHSTSKQANRALSIISSAASPDIGSLLFLSQTQWLWPASNTIYLLKHLAIHTDRIRAIFTTHFSQQSPRLRCTYLYAYRSYRLLKSHSASARSPKGDIVNFELVPFSLAPPSTRYQQAQVKQVSKAAELGERLFKFYIRPGIIYSPKPICRVARVALSHLYNRKRNNWARAIRFYFGRFI